MRLPGISMVIAATFVVVMGAPAQAEQLNQLARYGSAALALKDGVKAQAAAADRVEFKSNFDNGQTQGMNVIRNADAAFIAQGAVAKVVILEQNNARNGVQGMNVVQDTKALGVLQISKVGTIRATSSNGFNNTQGMNVIIGNGN